MVKADFDSVREEMEAGIEPERIRRNFIRSRRSPTNYGIGSGCGEACMEPSGARRRGKGNSTTVALVRWEDGRGGEGVYVRLLVTTAAFDVGRERANRRRVLTADACVLVPPAG